jgi:hypothetical protein
MPLRKTRNATSARKTRKTRKNRKTIQKQQGGDVGVLEEAKRLFHLAEAMDEGDHSFFLAGSVALLFHAAAKGIPVTYTPTDLDIRYMDPGALFVNHIQKRPSAPLAPQPKKSGFSPFGFMSLQTSFTANVKTCPEYVDFDIYRACAPVLQDVTFVKREDVQGLPMFESIDFTEVSRRDAKHMNTILIDGVRVLDAAGLKHLYSLYGQENSAWKIELLKQIDPAL